MIQNERQRNFFFVLTMVLMSIYLLWRMFFTLPWGQGAWNMVFGVLLVVAEITTVLTTFELFVQKMRKNSGRLELPVVDEAHYPHIDVLIVTHNEPVDLLYKTVNACTFLEYPDKRKVHIYLCDDGNRKEVAELAHAFGVGYLGLSFNVHAKSGNLNHALEKTSSPLIATFDADMIPQHTFLLKTVPYFFHSAFIEDKGIFRPRVPEEKNQAKKIGLVQTPQSFYNPDLFQFNLYAERNIPNEQDFFSREVNILRNTSNAVAYTGSNTVLSRQAIEAIGGFPLHTITEDFETSIRLQQEGYITYATDEVQAAGLSTTAISAMIKQRVRWARGVLQSLQNTRAIFSKRLPMASRITYLNSFLYWWSFFNRLIFILSPILFALFDFQIVEADFWGILIFWMPSYFFYSTSMRYLSSNVRSHRWSQVVDTIFMPHLILPVLFETLHIHERAFKVTNKSKSSTGAVGDIREAWPHVFLLILSLLALFRYTYGKYGWALFYSGIIIFWLGYNIVALLYALFFMLGRPSYRQSERIEAQESLLIQYRNVSQEACTRDVSEQGLSFFVPFAMYFPEREVLAFTVRTDRYQARLAGEIVYVRQEKEGWRYSARVWPLEETDRRHYMQIIYDRPHSLPTQLNPWITAYDDMVRNFKKRILKPFADKRKLARIPLAYPVVFENGASCVLRSFNYRYFSASDCKGAKAGEKQWSFCTPSGVRIHLQRTGIQVAGAIEELFLVENLESLAENHLLEQLLTDLQGDKAQNV